MSKKDKENIGLFKYVFNKLLEFAKLEFDTTPGKYNFIATIGLLIFIIVYSSSATICHFISSFEDCVKTIALHQDIYHPYDAPNSLKICIPPLIIIFFCLGYLIKHENLKNKIRNLE